MDLESTIKDILLESMNSSYLGNHLSTFRQKASGLLFKDICLLAMWKWIYERGRGRYLNEIVINAHHGLMMDDDQDDLIY